MSDKCYDVFISYKRTWASWVSHFCEELECYLGEELARKPEIFLDTRNIPYGTRFDRTLQNALASSKIIIPFLSTEYFGTKSEWCRYELAHVLMRQEQLNNNNDDDDETRKDREAQCLVVPVRIYDGDRFPERIKHIKYLPCNKQLSRNITKKTPNAVELEGLIKEWVPGVARAVESAPPYNPKWRDWDKENPRIKEIMASITVDNSDVRKKVPGFG